MTLTRDDFLKPKLEKVEVPELGGVVYIKLLSVGDVSGNPETHVTLARSLCDEDGKRLFEDGDALEIPITIATRLMEEITRVNGFNLDEQVGN